MLISDMKTLIDSLELGVQCRVFSEQQSMLELMNHSRDVRQSPKMSL